VGDNRSNIATSRSSSSGRKGRTATGAFVAGASVEGALRTGALMAEVFIVGVLRA
jgi:hypothetical protein